MSKTNRPPKSANTITKQRFRPGMIFIWAMPGRWTF